MPFLRKTLAITGWTSLGAALTFTLSTRKSTMHPVPDSDYLLSTTLFARYNPNPNPSMRDVCLRRVPLDRIRPELLAQEGNLVEAFCGAVWSGWAYAVQRRYLERKYRDAETEGQLWDVRDLERSEYAVGTMITDHFEVLSKTDSSIIVRCGDSPRVNAFRESDGLFELTADVKKEEGVVEFGMKSVFYNSIAQPDAQGKPLQEPVGPYMQWAHQKYTKLLMEDAARKCMR